MLTYCYSKSVLPLPDDDLQYALQRLQMESKIVSLFFILLSQVLYCVWQENVLKIGLHALLGCAKNEHLKSAVTLKWFVTWIETNWGRLFLYQAKLFL